MVAAAVEDVGEDAGEAVAAAERSLWGRSGVAFRVKFYVKQLRHLKYIYLNSFSSPSTVQVCSHILL